MCYTVSTGTFLVMQIDDNELARRLNSSKNLVNHLATSVRGRTLGHSNLTEQERDTIAELNSVHDIPQKEIAAAYGISQSTVSNCVSGEVGGRPANADRREKREALQSEIKDTALA